MAELHIIISGKDRSGKSTIASEIYTLLSDLGFTISVQDGEGMNHNTDSLLHQQKLEALRNEDLYISITTKNLRGRIE